MQAPVCLACIVFFAVCRRMPGPSQWQTVRAQSWGFSAWDVFVVQKELSTDLLRTELLFILQGKRGRDRGRGRGARWGIGYGL